MIPVIKEEVKEMRKPRISEPVTTNDSVPTMYTHKKKEGFRSKSLLASTRSDDIIAGGGIYSEELRASKDTPKNTKIVPITFYSLAKEYSII
ncbi:unnamed protein product [Bubo scandiacus]